MIVGYKYLSDDQRLVAVQRLTALWAFSESGLGGIMHALQIPFTGLVVGGLAVILISLIAEISGHNYKQILKSAVIVLIVKAMVSPYTPFPAYIAVSFQAMLGYALFSLLNINILSILLLSSIAMLESAIQKLLVLTLFFGESFWKALDSLVTFITGQLGISSSNGSQWIIGFYLFLYLAGGMMIARIAWKTIKGFSVEQDAFIIDHAEITNKVFFQDDKPVQRIHFQKLWILIILLIEISVLLFLFAADTKQGWLEVAKTISWTLSAIFILFMIIGPLFTKGIQKLLQKKESRYSDEVLKIISFLPVLRQLTALAWQRGKLYNGLARWQFFFSALIHWSLTYTEPASTEVSIKPQA